MTPQASAAAPDARPSPDPGETARRFVEARLAARALPGFPGSAPPRLEDGYAVQEAAILLWPAPVAGWKLGRIAPPLDAQLGAARVTGPVFADQLWRAPADGAPVDVAAITGGFAAVEAEYVLRLGRAPPAGRADLSLDEAAALVDAMFVGAEFAGSPLATINDLGPTVVASDFGNNAGLVLGPEVAGWRDRPLESLACETWIDGVCVGRGGAGQVPGGPVAALRDLVAILARRGRTLAADDLVTTGAATGVHDVTAGQEAELRFGGDGAIRLRIVPRAAAMSAAAREAERREQSLAATHALPTAGAGRFRWAICALLFVAMICNYIDRQMIGVLKPTLQHELGWTETGYANIVFWFQAAYAASYLAFGRLIDRIGARWGYALAFSIWTVGHIAHAAARSVLQFTLVRMVLGVGEGGSFPAGLKAVAEWFPKRERAFAVGLLNAGTNVGAIATPLIVPTLVLTLGWRWAFVITGALTSLWLVAWLLIYRSPGSHRRVGAGELAWIRSDPPDPAARVSWTSLLRRKETWAYAAAKFLIDPIWWMFLFWLPDFLAKRHGLDLKSFGPPLVVIYLVSDFGSVAGGWFSSALIKRGWSINAARKTAMGVAAVAVLPIAGAASLDSLWAAVAVVGLATAAHQWFSCNLYTLPSDVFPRSAVASVAGIGGTAGAIGGMLMAQFVGQVLEHVGGYTPIFMVAACVYLVALGLIHLLTPRYAEVRFPAAETAA